MWFIRKRCARSVSLSGHQLCRMLTNQWRHPSSHDISPDRTQAPGHMQEVRGIQYNTLYSMHVVSHAEARDLHAVTCQPSLTMSKS